MSHRSTSSSKMYAAVLLIFASSVLASALSCICQMDYTPVCGEDGVTYGNLCTFHCQNLFNVMDGVGTVALKCRSACENAECVGSREIMTYHKKYVAAPKHFGRKHMVKK